jgi:hypothetical protein
MLAAALTRAGVPEGLLSLCPRCRAAYAVRVGFEWGASSSSPVWRLVDTPGTARQLLLGDRRPSRHMSNLT